MQIFEMFDFNNESYDLKCRSFAPPGAPAGAMVCEVAPGSASRVHKHAETEAFLVLQGRGTVSDGVERHQITSGQGVVFPAFASHVIENTDPIQPLRMISVYWMGDLAVGPRKAQAPARDTLVFSTPPTPNGDLHLGHLSGPYLAADVLRRALTQRGVRARHITGRDDHQTYVLLKARRERLEPGSVADSYAGAIRSSLVAADITLDGFIEPKQYGLYADFAADLVHRLMVAGYIEARRAPVLLDEGGRVLHEAFVRGICPHCGSGADGNACEACGKPIGCAALLEPVDTITGRPAELGHAQRLHLLLSKLAKKLDVILKELRLPARVYACAQDILDAGIPDIPISQPTPWGLGVRVTGFEDQVLYAWFEMAAGYLFGAARVLAPEASDATALWAAARQAFSRDREVIHCYGFDNAWYHALLFPAIYAALGLAPPRVHVVNELLDLDGSKFSTSRNHLILGRDLLSEVSADVLRFGLCLARPQGMRADFKLDTFLRSANAMFCETIPAWIGGLDALLAQHGGCAPEPGAWLPDHEAYLGRIRVFAGVVEGALAPEQFDARGLAEAMTGFADDSRRFCVAQGALCASGAQADYARTAAALGLMGFSAFSILAEPVIPELGGKMRAAVGVSSDPLAALYFLPKGQAFDASRILLPMVIATPRTAAALVARTRHDVVPCP